MRDRLSWIEGKQAKVTTGEIIAQNSKCPLGRRLSGADLSLHRAPSDDSTVSHLAGSQQFPP